jgi:hypothetical protein
MINIANYTEEGLSRLLSQLKDKPNIDGILRAYLKEVTRTQSDSLSLLDSFDIETAYGFILDNLGRVVDSKRLGRGDESYRQAIKNRIYLNSSEGTPNQLIQILQLLSGDDTVKFFEHLTFNPKFFSISSLISRDMAQTLKESSVATTSEVGIYNTVNNDELVLSELSIAGGILIDESGQEFVTDQDVNLAVNYLSNLASLNFDKAILPELSQTNNLRIPTEYYHSS